MHGLKSTVSALAMIGFAGPGFAQAAEYRPYIEGQFGIAIPQDFDYSSDGLDGALGVPVRAEASAENALSFGAEAGVYLTPLVPGLRTSIGISHRSSDFEDVTFSTGGASETVDAAGDVDLTTLQANLYYDIHFDLPIVPFVGGGIGVTWANVDTPSNTIPSFDDSDSSFSWSLMTGLNYELTDNILVGGKYRFTRINGFDIDGTLDPANIGLGGAPLESSYETDAISLHEVLLTVAYRF